MMPNKVTVKVRYPRIDFKKTEKLIHEEMAKFTINQLKTWVLHTVDPIPVWSGAARASFLFLAAKAFTSITISPVAPSRISLGVTEADAEIIADRGKEHGWTWQSSLAHIGIVEDKVGFIKAGLDAINHIKSNNGILPQPITKSRR